MLKKNRTFFFIWMILLAMSNCIEPFTAETQNFENALVIDALLTNEQKQHTVKLSRSYSFESDVPIRESNAEVRISDDAGNTFQFVEIAPGFYSSTEIFAAVPGRNYVLDVTTADDISYTSETVIAPQNVPIENLYAEREINDLGEEGISIRLSNSNASAEPSYFRYEYEETYKIIAPNYDPFEFLVVDYTPCDSNPPYRVDIVPRQEQKRICFGYSASVTPIQASTIGLSGNRIQNFNVRFLSRNNYTISHRYSILVRQYSQTQDAHSYYTRLVDFSSSDNVFSQTQPGLLEGNILSKNTGNEKILGYFEVASVDEERVYFNYEDLFPGEPLPPYAANCNFVGNPLLVGRGYHCAPGGICDGACESPLIEAILAGLIVYRSVNENLTAETPGPYFTLPSPCGDCTKLGSNVVPDFWEE